MARLPRWTRCQSSGIPSSARILAHRRDDDPVVQHHVAQLEGRKHGRRRRAVRQIDARPVGGACSEPLVDAFDIVGVAQAQVAVADAQAAGQQREAELDRLKIVVIALRLLEPALRNPGRALQAFHLRLVGLLVLRETLADIAGFEDRPVQGDRVLHRQFGAGADGEMGGVDGVAGQHDIVERPVIAGNVGKLAPVRPVPDDLRVADIGAHAGRRRRPPSRPRR